MSAWEAMLLRCHNDKQLSKELNNFHYEQIERARGEKRMAKAEFRKVNNVIERHLRNSHLLQFKYGLKYENMVYMGSDSDGSSVDADRKEFDIAYCFSTNAGNWNIIPLANASNYESVPYKIYNNYFAEKNLDTQKLHENFCIKNQLNPSAISAVLVEEFKMVLQRGNRQLYNIQTTIDLFPLIGNPIILKIWSHNVDKIKVNITIVINFKNEQGSRQTRSMIQCKEKIHIPNTWICWFGLEEKKLMKSIYDGNSGCTRKIFKICKAMIQQDSNDSKKPYYGLTSYAAKNAIFSMNELSKEANWNEDNFVQRFRDVDLLLKNAITEKHLKRFFERDSQANVLKHLKSTKMIITEPYIMMHDLNHIFYFYWFDTNHLFYYFLAALIIIFIIITIAIFNS